MQLRLAGPADLGAAAAEIAAAPRIAVDTEFHAERRYLPRLYLVQIHVPDGATWIVDPLQPGALDAVREAMLAVPWVVHGGYQDMRLLNVAFGDLPSSVVDTQIAAGLLDHRFPRSYVDLVAEHMGVEVPKEATLSDWSRRPLAPDQIRYAAEDVELLLPLWDRLWQHVEAVDRAALVGAACDEARGRVLDPPSADLAWRDVAGAGMLSPQQASVLQELAAWREEVAERTDQPVRGVAPDAVLLHLARRQPLTLGALDNRRMSKSFGRNHGEEILARIAVAARRADWSWPRPIDPHGGLARAVAWLSVWADKAGATAGWSPRLVLPRSLLEDLASTPPTDRAGLSAALGPWRDALTGEPLWEALSGRTALALGTGDVAIRG